MADGADDVEPSDVMSGDSESGDGEGMSSGVVAAVVVCALLVLLAAVAVAFMMMRRSKAQAFGGESGGANIEFTTARERANTEGTYECAHCGKSYPSTTDLAAHVELRH